MPLPQGQGRPSGRRSVFFGRVTGPIMTARPALAIANRGPGKSPCGSRNARFLPRVKKKFYPLFALIAACHLQAEEKVAQPPAYVDEAPLPEKWPTPGPYGEVTEKEYPAYRAAFTDGKGESSAFWTLFLHIKKHDIPMTAPVEMPLEVDGGQLRQDGMAFLYQNGKVGTTGPDGTKVEVRDVPATRALSFAWQGDDGKKAVAEARAELEKALEERDLEATGFRLLGYNGPGTPREMRTWELQALLPK